MAHCRKSSSEQLALRISLAGTVLMAVSGLGMGWYVNSDAILLDGVFSLLSMAMTGLTLFTAHLVSRPDDEVFQFGYSHLEPLITVVNGLIILAICLFAFYGGVQAMLHGGNPINLDVALTYALLSTVFSFAIFFTERHIAREVDSELVRVDAQEWLVDGILSTTILSGFLLVMLLDALGYSHWNAYVDPILVSALALAMAMLPLQVLRRNLKEVLLMTPDTPVRRRVESTLAGIARRYDFSDYSCHFTKSGRQYDLEINILVADSDHWPLERQDSVREIIHQHLVQPLGDTWLSVSFTRSQKWL